MKIRHAAVQTRLEAIIRQELSEVGLRIDNSRISVEETVARIIRDAEQARV